MSDTQCSCLTDALHSHDVRVEALLVGEGQPEDGHSVVHGLLEADHTQLGDKQPHVTRGQEVLLRDPRGLVIKILMSSYLKTL